MSSRFGGYQGHAFSPHTQGVDKCGLCGLPEVHPNHPYPHVAPLQKRIAELEIKVARMADEIAAIQYRVTR